jgi:rhamnosyltransferase
VNLFPDADILVFLTQDAELASGDAIAYLCKVFDDPEVGAAYGRQLPRREAGAIEAHARLFNYPAASQMKSAKSQETIGFKSLFFSNSFGAYRRAALQAVGGFPEDVIFGEDTVTVAHLLQHGWKIAYVADAAVLHSHGYSISQEFRRYFDIGVLHSREAATFAPFGKVSGEGKKFVKSEMAFVSRRAPHLLLSAWLRTALKLVGYRLGRKEQLMPRVLKRRVSLSPSFWK